MSSNSPEARPGPVSQHRVDTSPQPMQRLRAAASMAAIRRRFLDVGDVPEDLVPEPIVRSWRRCLALGLSMDMRPTIEPLDRATLRERHDRAERLRQAAREELKRLHAEARASGAIVVLTDPDGFVLDTLGDADFAAKAARVALRPGAGWREAASGTNAIGTALAERRPITVVGGEHFLEDHRILSCTAAPILGPTGEAVGVLDLSGAANARRPDAAMLVGRAVAAIERRLFEPLFHDHDVVRLHRRDDAGGTIADAIGEGLLAFDDGRLVAANRTALDALDLDWSALGRTGFDDLFPTGDVGAILPTRSGEVVRVDRRRPPVRLEREREAAPSAPPVVAERPAAVVAASASVAAPRPTTIWDDTRSRALTRATRLVDADVPVLIQGETGTGKEVFARALHAACRRAARPFVAVNCAALPEGLIEAELFGYEEGAFTGARRKGSKGLMREADGGVLFLDEIGDMPLALQARLLRALQEREVTPLGGARPVPVDFALVCATHHGLAEAVERRAFRQDLYFRIAQYTVELEPLRGRPDLAEVIRRLWMETVEGTGGADLSAAALERLARYGWPGNFRQLTTTLRTLAILAEPGEVLSVDALPNDIVRATTGTRAAGTDPIGPAEATVETMMEARERSIRAVADDHAAPLDALARAAMKAALEASGGNVTRAAARLGVHRSTLYRKLGGASGGLERPAG